jgi:hypothetical protein
VEQQHQLLGLALGTGDDDGFGHGGRVVRFDNPDWITPARALPAAGHRLGVF